MADNVHGTESHKTSETPKEEREWHGGEAKQGREAQERSEERGWGAGMDEGDKRAMTGKEDDGRGQGEPSDRAGSGQGAKKN